MADKTEEQDRRRAQNRALAMKIAEKGGVRKSKMLTIRKKTDGKVVNIDANWFNPELHELVEDNRPKLTRVPTEEELVSDYTEEQMARMSVKRLRELPEADYIESGLRRKQEIIEAILEYRESREDDEE